MPPKRRLGVQRYGHFRETEDSVRRPARFTRARKYSCGAAGCSYPDLDCRRRTSSASCGLSIASSRWIAAVLAITASDGERGGIGMSLLPITAQPPPPRSAAPISSAIFILRAALNSDSILITDTVLSSPFET